MVKNCFIEKTLCCHVVSMRHFQCVPKTYVTKIKENYFKHPKLPISIYNNNNNNNNNNNSSLYFQRVTHLAKKS